MQGSEVGIDQHSNAVVARENHLVRGCEGEEGEGPHPDLPRLPPTQREGAMSTGADGSVGRFQVGRSVLGPTLNTPLAGVWAARAVRVDQHSDAVVARENHLVRG